MDTKSLTVGDVMTADPLTLEPEENLMRALEVMRMRGIRRIPVVLAGMLVGLLAEGDLKRA
ncbi:MAG TPA: CBS domain-containing protein, partial [Vicinamibacteria bacterium]|nr:CBS domain-containing protein [Vicinamibacteria bacterium]